MPKPNKKPHCVRAILDRDPVTRALTKDVVARCEKPNDRRLVDDVDAEFVEDLGDGLYVRVAAGDLTGEIVPIGDVCKRCLKAPSWLARLARKLVRALRRKA